MSDINVCLAVDQHIKRLDKELKERGIKIARLTRYKQAAEEMSVVLLEIQKNTNKIRVDQIKVLLAAYSKLKEELLK